MEFNEPDENEDVKYSKSQTRYFYLTWGTYILAIVLTTIYCYMRLDFVRSFKAPAPTNEEINIRAPKP